MARIISFYKMKVCLSLQTRIECSRDKKIAKGGLKFVTTICHAVALSN